MKCNIPIRGLILILVTSLLLPVQMSFAGELELKKHGVTLNVPGSWKANKHANITLLTRQPTETQLRRGPVVKGDTPEMMITTETRLDHAGAVKRLLDIGRVDGAEWSFLEIGGWPALEQQYLQLRPQPSSDDIEGSEMVLHVQTVIAADNLLIRMDTGLAPYASKADIEEVRAIGRSVVTPRRGDAKIVTEEIEGLRRGVSPPSQESIDNGPASASVAAPGVSFRRASQQPNSDLTPASLVGGLNPGATIPVSTGGGVDSELEIAVSPNGQDIVIGSNARWSYSNDGGQTWNTASVNGNDPSVAWGQSGGAQGTFYGANIGTGATSMVTSTDGGANWVAATNVYTCGQNGDPACGASFPDQEHIASDRWNVTAGGDQVYSAWRHVANPAGPWGIVCTQDSGNTWTANAYLAAGDFPKPAVGPDGSVYVVYYDSGNIMLDKFASCENQGANSPMVNVSGFPVVVKSNATRVACPTPGLDRCNRRNTLAGMTVAVDDTDSNHVYVAYALNTNPGAAGPTFEGSPVCSDQNLCNENIVVQDSLDGGATWLANADRTAVINTGVTARRFMPWLCVIDGTAHVSWYDRRAAFPSGGALSNNSLTDFYAGSASLDALGNLQSDGEFQVNELDTEDAQCEAGSLTGTAGSWPTNVDRQGDSESCSQQVQLGGTCSGAGGTRCDFSDCGGAGVPSAGPPCLCAVGQTCDVNRGWPKYGDYNGNACAAGRLYMTWASAVAPAAFPAPTNIDSFFSQEVVCCVPQIQVPGNIDFGEACGLDQQKETLNVCNTGKENLEITSITGDTQFAVTTPLSGFPVTISPDFCFPFEVTYDPEEIGDDTGVLTINNNDPVNPALEVGVSGAVGAASINTFIADSGNFGEICSGDLHDLNLTIQSNGNCPLEIDSVSLSGTDMGDFELPDGSLAGTVIESGNSLLVPVRFSPDNFTDPNPRTASVDVVSRTQGGDILTPTPDQTPVSGIVPPPDINVTIANEGDFGNICKGDHTDLDLTIFNNGKCDLTVESITLDPSDASFEFPATTDIPFVLSPDAEFTYPVRYAPDECNDTPEEADIIVGSDDPDEPEEVVGISGTSPCPNLLIDPTDLSGLYAFPATVVDTGATLGCYNDADVTLRNNGLCPLTITEISTDVPDFSVWAPSAIPAEGILLPPGEETLNVTVRFTPQSDLDPQVPNEVTGLLTIVSDDPDFPHTADLCGESALQSGVRILVSDVSSGVAMAVDEVDSMSIQSKGKNRPGPINLQFTDQPLSTADVCGNTIAYHVNQETLPSTDTTGSNNKSSYQAKAMEGNLQAAESFTLGQCEFRDTQLQLQDSTSPVCVLAQKGEACTTDGDCCSSNCKGPNGAKTCK